MAKKREIPNYQLPIVETHCHLDYLKLQEPAESLEQAQDYGIEKIITIAVSGDNLDTVFSIAQNNALIYCSQGIHPHEAPDFDQSVSDKIKERHSHAKVVAIGECGLDYYYDHADRAVQRNAFEQQLQLAADLDLPVIIHTRDADEDTQDILKNFSSSLKRKGVIHSFTSGQALAEYCLRESFCLGFNGICTFKNADNVRDIVAITPLEQALLETDAPYLTPAPYRGKENAPKYLPFIAEQIAEVKNTSVEAVLKQTHQNSYRVFHKLAG